MCPYNGILFIHEKEKSTAIKRTHSVIQRNNSIYIEMFRICKSIDTKNRLVVASNWGGWRKEWGVIGNGPWGFFEAGGGV